MLTASDSHEKEYERLLRVRKVCCLYKQAQKELFAPSFCAFIAPYSCWELSQTLPVCGKVPEESILKHGPLPSPRRGERSDLGCCTWEPVAAGSPLFAPAQCRFGSEEDAILPIPAGGINRHTQAAALRRSLQPSFSGCVGSRHRCNAHRWQGLSPYCARTDLVQTEKETEIRRSWLASWKRLCRKGFRSDYLPGSGKVFPEIWRKQTALPRGELRPSELPMKEKEHFTI